MIRSSLDDDVIGCTDDVGRKSCVLHLVGTLLLLLLGVVVPVDDVLVMMGNANVTMK